MRTSIRISSALLVGMALAACSNGSGSTGPGTGNSGATGLGSELVGAWKADTTVYLSAGVLSSVPLTATARTTFAADSTFSAYFDGDSILGATLQGHLFHETGTWKAKGTDTVVVHPVVCEAADTATTSISILKMSLPFHQSGAGYVANALATSACPDSMVIVDHPVAGVVHFTMPVNLPQVGKANWHLTFVKQP